MTISLFHHRVWRAVLVLTLWITSGSSGVTAFAQATPPRALTAQSNPEAVVIYRNASALQSREMYDLASQEWESLAQKFPGDRLAADAKFYRGVCLFQLRKYDEAVASFARVLKEHPNSELAEQAFANLGLAQYTKGQTEKSEAARRSLDAAVTTFDRQLARYPRGRFAPQAHFYRAEAFYLRDKPDQAAKGYRDFLASAAKDHPLRPQALYGLGVTLDDAKQSAAAGRVFHEFLKIYPRHELQPEIRLRLGDALLAEGKLKEAAAHFAAAAKTPDFEQADEAFQRQAICHYQLMEYIRAAELYATLADRFPQSPLAGMATASAGKCYYLGGEKTSAEVWLRRAMAAGGSDATDAAHWLARTMMRAGRAKDAVELLTPLLQQRMSEESLVKLKKDRADALFELPDRRREAAKAYAEIARGHADHPLAAEAAYLAAHTSLNLGDYEAARDQAASFENAFSKSELLPDAKGVAAEASLQLGQHAEAARVFGDLAKKYPDHPQRTAWRVRLANCFVVQQKWHEAISVLEPLVRDLRDPALTAKARLLLGKSYLAVGRANNAITVLRLLVEDDSNPQQAEAQAIQARAETADGKPKAALATLDRLIRSHPKSSFTPQAYLSRATLRHESGDDRGALDDLAHYLATNPAEPTRSDALLLRGTSQARLKEFADATRTFEAIIKANPRYTALDRVIYELAWSQEGAGRPEQAAASFARLAREYPESPLAGECWYRVADAQFAAGNFAKAEANYRKAYGSKAAAGDVRDKALHKLAWIQFQQADYVAAERAFDKELQEFPAGPLAVDARLMLGESQFKQAKYAAALNAMTTALAKKPSSETLAATGLVHAAQAAGQLGKWDQSLSLLDRFLRENPNSRLKDEAVYEKAWALYNTKQRDAAQQLFDEVAARNASVVGARARFMVGEIQFANKDYDAAVRTFFKVAYGYGEQAAPEAFHHWQSEAMFEAGRCLEESKRLQSAQKVYEDLVARYPKSEKTPHARVRLREVSARISSRAPR